MAPKNSIDADGIPELAKAFKGDSSSSGDGDSIAKVVMLSTASVTDHHGMKKRKLCLRDVQQIFQLSGSTNFLEF